MKSTIGKGFLCVGCETKNVIFLPNLSPVWYIRNSYSLYLKTGIGLAATAPSFACVLGVNTSGVKRRARQTNEDLLGAVKNFIQKLRMLFEIFYFSGLGSIKPRMRFLSSNEKHVFEDSVAARAEQYY